jgi:hypothetical protein
MSFEKEVEEPRKDFEIHPDVGADGSRDKRLCLQKLNLLIIWQSFL